MTIIEKLSYESLGSELFKFIDLFNSDQESKSYLSDYINKFSRIKERLDSHKLEVAIIGITSSGKSTMLNSILGEKLLPEKVKPSSGIQVMCEYGETFKAVIYFNSNSGKNPELVTENISEKIESYGDETKNPFNEKEVDEIRLYSPKFRLNKNIILVDTPGLDAYGLESHEKITLQLVLPTVQMIMFLTTVKASSDSKNLELIDQVTTENKPLIIVQNMIDSIFPKESREGISKTVEEIQKEHYTRIHKLIQSADKKSVKLAPIVQISALKAKQDWKSSGMGNLRETLNDLIKQTEPTRLSLFVNQINNYLKEIEEDLDSNKNKNQSYQNILKDLVEKEINIESLVKSFQKKESEFNNYINSLLYDLNNLSTKICHQYSKLSYSSNININSIKNMQFNNPKEDDFTFQNDIDNLVKAMSEINYNFSDYIGKIQIDLELLCSYQNLQTHDIIKRQRIREFNTTIDTITFEKNDPIRKREKKKGVWNWFKGFFGEEDYEYVEYDNYINVVNINKLLKDLFMKAGQWEEFITTNLKILSESTKYSLKELKSDIENKKVNERNRLGKILNQDISKSITIEITNFFDKFKIYNTYNNQKSVESYYKYDIELSDQNRTISKLSLNLFQLAHYHSFKRLYDLRNKVIEKSQAKNILVLGWDNIHINRFMDYYFSDLPDYNIEENHAIKHLQSSLVSSITVVNESKIHTKEIDFADETLIFIIVNTIQKGSTLKKLKNSLLMKRNFIKVVWVMDSVIEFVNNDSLIEGFNEFKNIIENSGKNISEVMASDKDLYYTVLLHELYFNHEKLESKNYQQQFIKDMKDCFNLNNDTTNKIGNYIDQWRSLCSKTLKLS